ncbi:uncharacterized protein TNCV_3309911 [Trichonephila clavipes]|nr:uncharacterized protein TNCV_3309911 [Trichonephila clavipes]
MHQRHRHVFERGTVTNVRHRCEDLEPYVRFFTGVVGPDFNLIDPTDGLVREISRPNLYKACLGRSEEDNCKSQTPFKNHSRPEKRVSEQAGLIAPQELKLH